MSRRESINGLSELTGFNRMTIKKKIAHLSYVVEGKSHMYLTEEALPVLYEHDGGLYVTDQERARLLHHQANIAALDEEVKKRTLIPGDVVRDKWVDILSTMRARLLSMPPQLAATCANLSSEDIERKAGDLVRQALEEMASDPEY